jgi:hypothetical protein
MMIESYPCPFANITFGNGMAHGTIVTSHQERDIPNLTKIPSAGMLAQNGGLMTAKPTRYFWIVFLALLTACGNNSQAAEMTKIQNTANTAAWTYVALTQTAMPTATPPPSTFTPTALPTPTTTPSPEPIQPPVPILTPDAIQVERWREYQTELAKLVLSDSGVANPIYADALCEWDILGRSGQEVYVWAVCGNFNSRGEGPAVIYLETDGSIQKVIAAGFKGLNYNLDLFPVDVQAKINLYLYGSERAGKMRTYLEYRLTHPEEPPLIVLSMMPTSTPAATPTPAPPTIPILTPDAIQLERWKEYQTELAKSVLPYDPSPIVLCEWAILGQSNQEVYLWAVCEGGMARDRAPVVVYLNTDGTIQNAKAVEYGSMRKAQIQQLFPPDIQEKIYSELTSTLDELLTRHLSQRSGYPESLPLIVLGATPMP